MKYFITEMRGVCVNPSICSFFQLYTISKKSQQVYFSNVWLRKKAKPCLWLIWNWSCYFLMKTVLELREWQQFWVYFNGVWAYVLCWTYFQILCLWLLPDYTAFIQISRESIFPLKEIKKPAWF